MPSLAEFRAEFPEFERASDALVQAKLDESTERCPTSVWTDTALRETGIKYLTADTLARMPFGRGMKLVLQDGRTVYTDILKQLRHRATMGLSRVT